MTKSIWVNDQLSTTIDIHDRGFMYGDGLFETMRVSHGRIALWDLHIARLQAGCERLKINLPTESELEQSIVEKINNTMNGVVKLVVTRGITERGYRYNDAQQPNIIIMLLPYPAYPNTHWQNGICLTCCETRLAQQPLLAGIKHMNRLEQVMARNEWHEEFDEGVMLDINGNVIEGTVTNIFVRVGESVMTPSLDKCGVAGVMRNKVMQLLENENIKLDICDLSLTQVTSADEIWLTNSLIGVWPVKQFLNNEYMIGDITRHLQNQVESCFN